ncbi:MAG TPA: hypothetical protein VHE34_01140 [Puia sp.]|uniref:hypothetical protein n=1 Tax=Puia sp. TaxID=2045100 RepID=UPI002B7C30E3|nr:hypothetical protein [Puia sp.]HVU93788.1 hypothetical protein [Puia sp.]
MFDNIEALQTLQTREDTKTLTEAATALNRTKIDIGCVQTVAFIGTGIGFLNWMLDLGKVFRCLVRFIRISNEFEKKLIDYWILPGFIEY